MRGSLLMAVVAGLVASTPATASSKPADLCVSAVNTSGENK